MRFTSMRPTFEMKLPYSRDEVFRRIREKLEQTSRENTWLFFDQYAELHLPERSIRYWSPHLTLSFEEDGLQTRIHGRFAPRQQVWTLVWVLYLLFAFSAFFLAMFEIAFWMMGQTSWFSVACILALAGLGVIYLTSQIGQRWSEDQMLVLKSDWLQVIGPVLPSD
jgi:hypothetical protein